MSQSITFSAVIGNSPTCFVIVMDTEFTTAGAMLISATWQHLKYGRGKKSSGFNHMG